MLGSQGTCGQEICMPYSNIVTGGYSINTSMQINFDSTKLTDIRMHTSQVITTLGMWIYYTGNFNPVYLFEVQR